MLAGGLVISAFSFSVHSSLCRGNASPESLYIIQNFTPNEIITPVYHTTFACGIANGSFGRNNATKPTEHKVSISAVQPALSGRSMNGGFRGRPI